MTLTSPRGFIKKPATNICTPLVTREDNEETIPDKVRNHNQSVFTRTFENVIRLVDSCTW